MSVKPGGKHVILDIWNVADPQELTMCDIMQAICEEAAKKSNAKIITSNFHSFGSGQGITGVVILAESHISIHTWPHENYAAVDIFMCGMCDPQIASSYIQNRLQPSRANYQIFYRGEIDIE